MLGQRSLGFNTYFNELSWLIAVQILPFNLNSFARACTYIFCSSILWGTQQSQWSFVFPGDTYLWSSTADLADLAVMQLRGLGRHLGLGLGGRAGHPLLVLPRGAGLAGLLLLVVGGGCRVQGRIIACSTSHRLKANLALPTPTAGHMQAIHSAQQSWPLTSSTHFP